MCDDLMHRSTRSWVDERRSTKLAVPPLAMQDDLFVTVEKLVSDLSVAISSVDLEPSLDSADMYRAMQILSLEEAIEQSKLDFGEELNPID